MDTLSLILLGLYTIVYLIVFVVQKSQMDKLKTISEQTVSFMSLFDVEKVKAYNKIVEEPVNPEAKHFLAGETKIDELIPKSIDKTPDLAYKNYIESVGKKHIELRDFAIRVLLNFDGKEIERIIEGHLPENKDLLLDLISTLRTKQT